MKKLSLIGIAIATGLVSSAGVTEELNGNYYSDLYCMTCHGAEGVGNVGVLAPRLAGMEPWYLKRQLESFRAGTRGVHPMDIPGSEMRPMATKLSDESITTILNWVGKWEYRPAEITLVGDTESGKLLYASCASCHGSEAEGNEAQGAPALAGENDWYLVAQLQNFKAGYRGADPQDSFGAQMAPMAAMLRDQSAIDNVVSFINTLGR